MNVEALWPWLCYGWLAGEGLIALTTHTRRSGGKVQDRGSLWILRAMITAAFLGEDWIGQIAPARMFAGAEWLRPLSLAILVAGLAIRATAIVTLGKAFSVNVAIRDSQKVQRKGLYRLVRHPSYLGMELIFLAVGLRSRNWACLAWMFILPSLAILYRIYVEEAALRKAFGEEYAAYSRETKRLIPGVF
jgi:protein-S-isoprenylcysteine O-methyltransferase Ste14